MHARLTPEQRENATVPLDKPNEQAPGVSGKGLSNGRPYGYEKHRTLGDHRNAIADYRKILKTESAVWWPWQLRLNGLLTATWGVEKTERTSEAAYELCLEQFGDGSTDGQLHRPLESILSQMYLSDVFGFSVMVPEWESDGSVYWCRDVVNRVQDTVWGWDLDEFERLVGVVQRPETLYGYQMNGRGRFIPANECLFIVRNPEARTDLTGDAMLRPIHPLWMELVNCRNNGSIADQRWAVPTPKVHVKFAELLRAVQSGGIGAIGKIIGEDPSGYIAAERAELKTQAENYAANGQGMLVDSDIVSFESFGHDSYDPSGNLARQRHLALEIARVFTAQFMMLGSEGSGGSYSLGSNQMEAYTQSLINTAERIQRTLNGPDRRGGGLVGRLCAYNLPGIKPEELPVLKYEGLQSKAYMQHLQALPGLFEKGILTAFDGVEREIGPQLGLPRLPEEYEREPVERMANPNSIGGVAARNGRLPVTSINRPQIRGEE